jgi:hypothetical protein
VVGLIRSSANSESERSQGEAGNLRLPLRLIIPVQESPIKTGNGFTSQLTGWEEKIEMGLAQYSIVPVRGQWGVSHDGNVNGEYATKESAFESAIMAASLAIRQGHEVHVNVPGRKEGEAALVKEPG